MFPVITGEPDALSLTTKLEQNVLERERKETEREREALTPRPEPPQTSGGPIRPRGFNSPSCPGEEEREREHVGLTVPHARGRENYGRALEPGGPNSPLKPGRRRERERILAQVLHLCLGACAAPLAQGGRQGVNLDCHSRGAFLPFPAALESSRPPPRCLRGPFKPRSPGTRPRPSFGRWPASRGKGHTTRLWSTR